MTPYEIAVESYYSVEQDVEWSEFLTKAFRDSRFTIISNDSFFVIAESKGKVMHIHELAGSISHALDALPEEVDIITFERRDDKRRGLSVDRLKRVLKHIVHS